MKFCDNKECSLYKSIRKDVGAWDIRDEETGRTKRVLRHKYFVGPSEWNYKFFCSTCKSAIDMVVGKSYTSL